ncbi:ORF6N domain-containing protein [Pectobacterium polaris]|uniref:ORF6N domain-containing protein n=1 Tax=Pectobacterium polaris TaxID=2042057 RepID=UPI001CF2C4B7|nr:ORF6N domain-containing protein [Pectobacterium polaris]MCA6956375.1 ORF6N domain-containing protein [Pectobacterium polaris]
MNSVIETAQHDTQANAIPVESLCVTTHNGIPVITTELMASLYCTERQRITNNFNRNKDRFVIGKHYFKLDGENLESLRNSLRVSRTPIHPSVRALMLWTQRGAARHAKMLETDQAWDVFEKLEDFYFSQREKRVEEPVRKTKQSTAKQLTPLRQTVERLITSGVGNIYPDIWKLVHKRFDIENIQQLPPDQINEAISYLDALEGEYIQRGQQPTKTTVAPVGSRRVLLYLDANGSVTSSLPIAPDELVASWNTFIELARRENWIVARREDFAAKLSNLFI